MKPITKFLILAIAVACVLYFNQSRYLQVKRMAETSQREADALKRLAEAAFKEGVQSGLNFTLNWALSHGGRLGELPVKTISEQCWTNSTTRRQIVSGSAQDTR